MFHYVWQLTEDGHRPGPELRTRSPVYRASFPHDGVYSLRVAAVDRYGFRSLPRDIDFHVSLPKPDPLRETLFKAGAALISTGALYLLLMFPLVPLYPRFSWARTAMNSGLLTKFPLAHKAILDTRWARRCLFHQLAAETLEDPELPDPYVPQSVFAARDRTAHALPLDGGSESLKALLSERRRALVIARSGTGKSVLLRYLRRQVAEKFLRGERVPVPRADRSAHACPERPSCA